MTEIHFYCVLCGAPMKSSLDRAGKVRECARCMRFVPVPPGEGDGSVVWSGMYPPDIIAIEILFSCPECGARLAIDAAEAASTVRCPPCGRWIKVPQLPASIPSSASHPASAPASEQPVHHLSPEEIDFLNCVEPEFARNHHVP